MAAAPGAEMLGDLVERAQARLQRRGRAQQSAAAEEAARAEKAEAGLRGAIAEMRAGGSEARAAALRGAQEAAARAGRAPNLRVEAQRMLDQWYEQERRSQREERLLERLLRQLSEATGLAVPASKANSTASGAPAPGDALGCSRPPSPGAGPARATRKQVDGLLGQLRRAADNASREGGAEEMVATARQLIQRVERARRKDEQAAGKLSGLLRLQDADQLGSSMRDVLEKWQPTGDGAQRVAAQLEERVAALTLQKQHQDWLQGELDAAAARLDSARLLQLCDQARALQLTVPSEMVALLHELEEGAGAQGQGGAQAKAAARRTDHLARLREESQKKVCSANAALDAVEATPATKELRAAQGAVLALRQARGAGPEEVRAAERRLARVERLHEPHLEVEEELQTLLDKAEGPQWHTLLLDGTLVERLRTALRKAEKTAVGSADPGLCQLGHELLQRTAEAEEARRAVEQRLRDAMGRGGARSDRDLEALSEAVEEARRLGLDTLAADRELARRRDWQDHVAVAEAELREASKGVGPSGRARLESALRGAKEAGVSADRLRLASGRLEELARHERRCALAAGNIKRSLPTLEKEPWQLQPLLEAARSLEPWTPELDKLAQAARERVEGASTLQQRRKDVEQEMRARLRGTPSAASGGGGEPAAPARPGPAQEARVLAGLAEKGKALGADPGLLREVGERLRGLRREGRQLDVAQQRLRLAVGQKDLPGIERELRAIRAMGASAPGAEGVAGAGAAGQGASARGERSGEQPHSERLMEAAAAMMRHLQDSQVRRQNAQTALCERLSGDAAVVPVGDSGAASPLPSGDAGAGPAADSQGWLKEVTEMIHEAKQSGVPPTLVEHARLRVREVRRWESERQVACAALQQSLAKKGAPAEEVLRNLRRVQRLEKGAPNSAR